MGLGAAAAIGIALTLKDEFSSKLGTAGKNADAFGQKLKGLEGLAQRAGTALKGAGDGMATWGGRGTAVIGAGMAVGLKNAAEQAMKTEHALASIANTAGVGNDKFKGTVGSWKTELIGLSQETNQLQGDLTRGFGTLVSKGLDPSKALSLIKPIGHAALATGSDVDELGKSLYATYDNLKVPLADADKALEVMAKAGNEGAFELKDMATYFPQLTASAQQLGMKGTDGVASLGAALQIALKGAGDPAEAAGNMKNFMAKLSSPETVKNFKKFGVNYQAEMKKAIQSGDPMLYFTELVQRTTKGDRLKLGQLFGDMQVQNFLTPMLTNLDEYKRIRNEAANSKGLIAQQEVNMLQTAQEQMKRLQINTEAAMQSSDKLGGVYDKLNATLKQFNDEGWTKTNMALAGLAAAGGVWAGGKALSWGGGKLLGKVGGKAGGAMGAALGAGDGSRVFVTNWPGAMGGVPSLPGAAGGGAAAGAASGGVWAAITGAATLGAKGALRGIGYLGKPGAMFEILGNASLRQATLAGIRGLGVAAVGTSTAMVAAAGAVGYGIGTLVNKLAIEGTEFGDSIGEMTARAMAFFGNEEAKTALRQNGVGLNDERERRHRENKETLKNSALAQQKIGGEIAVKITMPPQLSATSSVTSPSGQTVKFLPNVGNYGLGSF